MIAFLDTVGPAVWRASWQASVLALVVFVLLRALGERVSPRWRYLFWSVVILRSLFVVTPTAPWSGFNLIPQNRALTAVADRAAVRESAFDPQRVDSEPARKVDRTADEIESEITGRQLVEHQFPESAKPADDPAIVSTIAPRSADAAKPSQIGLTRTAMILRILGFLWLAGCLWFAAQLGAAAYRLRKQISICRPVTDAAFLDLLETAARRIGLKRTPVLLVTPAAISPCLVGTWRSQIVLPESLVTGSSTDGLRHVLTHELAHLVRGDLWTNWLLLAARVLHWFNPIAWWTVREMQAEREAACDELALASFAEVDRRAYAATILDLAATLAPSTLAPGMIGLFSSTGRLKRRVERLAQRRSTVAIRTPLIVSVLLAFSLIGLTDAMPPTKRDQLAEGNAPQGIVDGPQNEIVSPGKEFTLRGRCVSGDQDRPVAGVRLRLFKVEGSTAPIVELAKTISDREGRFAFADLAPPRPDDWFDLLKYVVTGHDDMHPIAVDATGSAGEDEVMIRMEGEKMSLSGIVSNSNGEPVAGATILRHPIEGRAIPGILSATTDSRGQFEIDDVYKLDRGAGDHEDPFGLVVVHPDYPETSVMVSARRPHATITMPVGCEVTGTVTDKVTGKPAVGAVVVAQGTSESAQSHLAPTDEAGRFRIVIPEGDYNFLVEAKDLVCVALTGHECLAGKKLELPQFQLVAGGFISGRVLDTTTGKTITSTDNGERRKVPIRIAWFGPAQSQGKSYYQSPLSTVRVDDTGRFLIRAAAGENFPYFLNLNGERMAWNTKTQPAVVVKEGETVIYDMLVTPPVSEEQKLKDARQVVAALPKQPAERAARILSELSQLKEPVGENALWCALLKELVAIGPEIVPQLGAELDRTNENAMFSRLGFALRAIGDPRAVPALIRALPKTLDHPNGGFLTTINDLELATFMQEHGIGGQGRAGTGYFFFGRPVDEIRGALTKLTGQVEQDAEILRIRRSADPRRQILQRRLYLRAAQRWEAWWEAHWMEFTADAAYRKVNLEVVNETLPPAPASLGPSAKLGDSAKDETLSPVTEEDPDATYFYDLDTGVARGWPAHIPKDAAHLDEKQLTAWAAENGVDLMCVTQEAPDGSEGFVLRSFGMKVREISRAELKELDKLIAAGKLPEGRAVGDLLTHFDPESNQPVAATKAAFIYVTREGCLGLIEVTDQVTHKMVMPHVSPQPDYGFYRGVRFNLKSIVP